MYRTGWEFAERLLTDTRVAWTVQGPGGDISSAAAHTAAGYQLNLNTLAVDRRGSGLSELLVL
jgi:hypothetical protein